MITEDKIKIHVRYDGQIDRWVRSGSKNEKSLMTDDDWYVIDSLVQDLFLVKKGVVSNEFKQTLEDKLKENCDSENTITNLKKLAG